MSPELTSEKVLRNMCLAVCGLDFSVQTRNSLANGEKCLFSDKLLGKILISTPMIRICHAKESMYMAGKRLA